MSSCANITRKWILSLHTWRLTPEKLLFMWNDIIYGIVRIPNLPNFWQMQLSKPGKGLHPSQLQPGMHIQLLQHFDILHLNSVLRKISYRKPFFSHQYYLWKGYVTWKGKPVAVYTIFCHSLTMPLINFLHSVKDSMLKLLLYGLLLASSGMTMQNVNSLYFPLLYILYHASQSHGPIEDWKFCHI